MSSFIILFFISKYVRAIEIEGERGREWERITLMMYYIVHFTFTFRYMAASLLAAERCFGKRGDKHRATDLTRIEPTKSDPPKMRTLNKMVQRKKK